MLCFLTLSGCQESVEKRVGEAMSLGNFQEAVDLLRPEVEERPADAALSALYGAALVQNKQPSLAIWPLRRAYKSLGNENNLGLLLARALSRGGASAEAMELVNELIEEDPDSVPLLILRARVASAVLDRERGLSDLEHLIELQPGNGGFLQERISLLIDLERIEEAGAAVSDFRARVEAGEVKIPAGGMPRFCGEEARFHQMHGEMERSRELFEECVVEYPAEGDLLIPMLEMLYASGDFDRAAELLEEQATSDLGQQRLRIQLLWVEDLEVREDFEEAEAVLRGAAENMEAPQPWLELADFYLRRDNMEGAAEALNRAVSWAQGGGEVDPSEFDYALIPQEGLFAYGDVLVQTGEFDRVQLIIESIEEPVYRTLLRARMKHAQGDVRGALDGYNEAFRTWSSNAGARYLAAEAALTIGEFEEATNHYTDSLRADAAATDAGIVLARILIYQHLLAAAFDTLIFYVHNAPTGADRMTALLLLNQLSRETLAKEASEFAREELKRLPDPYAPAHGKAGYALVVARIDGVEAALAYLEEDPSLGSPLSAPALLTWARLKQGTGQADEARVSIEAALANAPDSFELKTVLAGVYLNDPEFEERAGSLLEEAIAQNPDYMPSRLGRIELLVRKEGREDDIVEEWTELARIDPKDPTFGHEAAMVLMHVGKEEEALDRLHAHLKTFPWYGDSAMEIADKKNRANDTNAETWRLARLGVEFGFRDRIRSREILGQVRLARGEAKEAEEVFLSSIQLDPTRPESHYYLGLAFDRQGRSAEAMKRFKHSLELGDFAQAEDARALVMIQEEREESSSPVEDNKAETE